MLSPARHTRRVVAKDDSKEDAETMPVGGR